ncbi:MAG: low molecular weight protein arginine phosphatase [Ruminococcaceae bacterium]|nr:low molecular weight protein arginine phosphatase [Oscillospiraceae bacterium]
MKVLFVCTGNTCRSAMCEGIFKHIAKKDNIEVTSAGLGAIKGDAASENAVLALSDLGIDISNHKSKPLTNGDVFDADLVLCMTKMHSNIIKQSCQSEKDKVFTLYEYATGTNKDVKDPYGTNLESYKQCAKDLKELLKSVYEKVTKDD